MVLLCSIVVQAGVFLEPLNQSDKIYRGRTPRANEIKRLTDTGINTVLIFKDQKKTEVDDEIDNLVARGFDPKRIIHIPFLWKNIVSEKLACEQTVQALQILRRIQNSKSDKLFFHCTVGEDRTGLLAALFDQIMNGTPQSDSYIRNMCMKGYAGGNTEKPEHVSDAVDQYLSPLYFKLSKMIEQGDLSMQKMSKSVCAKIEAMTFDTQYERCGQVVEKMKEAGAK